VSLRSVGTERESLEYICAIRVCKDLRHLYMSPQTLFPVYLMY
jgi:hypothetical protein